MKKMKKILAMVLAMAMVLGMSVTAFAELAENQHEATGTSSDTGTIKEEQSPELRSQLIKLLKQSMVTMVHHSLDMNPCILIAFRLHWLRMRILQLQMR